MSGAGQLYERIGKCYSGERRTEPRIAERSWAALCDAPTVLSLLELRRVARRVVVFQWDNTRLGHFWLVRDYVPEALELAGARPTLAERAQAIGAMQEAVPIPWDCVDGFIHASWRRPEAYLEERVRRGSSVWARFGPTIERRAVRALAADLASGRGHDRNAGLLEVDACDLGARLLVAGR